MSSGPWVTISLLAVLTHVPELGLPLAPARGEVTVGVTWGLCDHPHSLLMSLLQVVQLLPPCSTHMAFLLSFHPQLVPPRAGPAACALLL